MLKAHNENTANIPTLHCNYYFLLVFILLTIPKHKPLIKIHQNREFRCVIL